MHPWVALGLAGLFEVGFTTAMKLSDGFSKPLYLVPFAICAVLSFGLLSLAIKQIPLGTAYAMWTGIGALGTAVVGMVFFKDPVSWPRIGFLLLIVVAIVGLKLVSSPST